MTNSTTCLLAVSAAGALCCAATALGEVRADLPPHPDFPAEAVEYFTSEVRPILAENCFRCHGGEHRGELRVRSGFQIISRRGLLLGGDRGPAVDPANPAASNLLAMISYADRDHQMPPSGKLPDEQIETLTKWIEMGAPWTPDDIDHLVEVEDEHAPITKVNEMTRSYWSYRPMERPEVPRAADPAWNGNPIDAFVAAKLEDAGLDPNGPAQKRELIRRATYDLTGLPPSPEETEAFARDASPEAWPRLIERLLASPHYGEKWGRHWLDVVRYAESNGFERDSEKPFIWRYRDYVIDAFNGDKPYDRFVLEQLAGDEVADGGIEGKIATGYHRLMQWDDEPADPLQHKYDVLDDNVRTTAEGMLAMTVGCARCHDHKGDPISQEDYYSFMAFFHGVTQMSKEGALETVTGEGEGAAPAANDDRLAALSRQIAEIERLALERFARIDEKLAAELRESAESGGGRLVPDSRERGESWRFTTETPPDDWFTVGFRARRWGEGTGGFGNGIPAARTPWAAPDIWLQKTFSLTEIPSGLELVIRWENETEVYLNGQLIAALKGVAADYAEITLGPDAVGALQTGRNVLAVHARHTGGEQFLDLGLRRSPAADVAELILARGEEIFEPDQVAAYRGFRRELTELLRATANAVGGAVVMAVQEGGPTPPPLHVHIRGSASAPGDVAAPRVPEIFGGAELPIDPPPSGAGTSGRRLALAQWISRPDNPRTARVMVNRIWQHHFGRGLCTSSNDFGFLGEQPTHPELLDWLATEFVRRGWSIKEMHRLIMTSRTYQMSSRARPEPLAADPENKLFWRFDMRRLTAEEIRDSILALSDSLNLRVGGPSVFIELPEEVLATSSKGAAMWGRSSDSEERRRSVYVTVKRSLKPPMFTDFDFADTDSSCPVRFATTVPTQALGMLNSEFVNDEAARFADRLRRECGDDFSAAVRRAFELAASRPARPDEIAAGLDLIAKMTRDHGASRETALERFCLLVLNLNEFVFID